MASEAAALLDELMGAQRNALPGEKVRETRWSDPEVCRHFLCGFCPSELFTNTKSDIGPCDKMHDERLKRMYQESERCGKLGYEDEFLHYLEKIVRDLDRRIERGRERLQKSVSAKQKVLQGESGINSDKLKALNDEINLRVAELDRLGTMGQVEEAQQLMKKVEELEKDRERERMHLVNMTHKRVGGFDLDAHDFHEKMELCDVCGSFLVIGDVQLRVDAHLLGKQHLGFARIRATIAELKKAKEDKIKKRHGELEDGDRRSSGHDDKDAVDKDVGEKDGSKDDEKEKHIRGKTWRVSRDSRSSRSRSRERDHSGRQAPRSREHKPRSPERESKGIGRSRSKEREGNRRRSRSHSRGKEQPDKRHRTRSRSRERRKEEERSRERPKDRDGKERPKEEREKPREDRSREEKPRDDKPREDKHEGRDRGREDRRERDRDRSGRPKEREERDKPKDGSFKNREGSR